MNGFNRVIFSGNIGKDPEMTFTPNGIAVTKFTLAVNFYNSAKKTEESMWLNCVAFGSRAEYINENCQRGTHVLIDGSLQITNFKKKDGTFAQWTQVILEEKGNFEITARRREKKEEIDLPDIPEGVDLDEHPF